MNEALNKCNTPQYVVFRVRCTVNDIDLMQKQGFLLVLTDIKDEKIIKNIFLFMRVWFSKR